MSHQRLEDACIYLQGSCQTLEHAAALHEVDEEKLEAYIDDQQFIFLCTQCGWWCETSDEAEEQDERRCTDCAKENK